MTERTQQPWEAEQRDVVCDGGIVEAETLEHNHQQHCQRKRQTVGYAHSSEPKAVCDRQICLSWRGLYGRYVSGLRHCGFCLCMPFAL